MTIPSIQNLSIQFSQALQEGLYIGLSTQEPTHLIKAAQKAIRLNEVYQRAETEIEGYLGQDSTLENYQLSLTQLRLLDADGIAYYERYCAHTKTWTRWFLKGIAHYTPTLLKNILPRLFSNGLEEAERKTKQSYESYHTYLQNCIQNLTDICNALSSPDSPIPLPHLNSPLPPLNSSLPPSPSLPPLSPSFFFPASPLPSSSPSLGQSNRPFVEPNGNPPILEPQPIEVKPTLPQLQVAEEQVQERRQKFIASSLTSIKTAVASLNQSVEKPLSSQKFMQLLQQIHIDLKTLFKWAPELDKKATLEALGMDEKLRELFIQHSLELTRSILTRNQEALQALLLPTTWGPGLEKAINPTYIQFGIQQILGRATPRLSNEKGERVMERAFASYDGCVVIRPALNSTLQALHDHLEANPTCRPSKLEINFEQTSTNTQATDVLNPAMFALILKLSTLIPNLSLAGLKEIDFKQLNASAEQEKQFMEALPGLEFPERVSLTLTDEPKTAISPEQLSALLHAFPSPELMKVCLCSCSSPQDIALPPILTRNPHVDLSGYPLELVPLVLNQFPVIHSLKLDQPGLTEQHLQELFQQGCFQHLRALDLTGCQELTTDALFTLTQAPNLTSLQLPELKEGTYSLKDLPKFEDPFKIHLFYTQTAQVRPLANDLYIGLPIWASVFQIPLARANEAQLFSDRQTVLDPKSVTYWMYRNDYRQLNLQPSIQTIIADNCEYLNDDNLVEFAQKFPNVTELSLYNCPHLTDKGIVALLQACPKINKLDLTSCQGITNDLLLNNQPLLQSRGDLYLILNDTQVSSGVAEIFQENELRGRLLFEEKTLKIKNEDLVNENPVNEDLVNENPVNEDLVNENPVNEDLVNENPVNEDLVNENPVNEDLVNKNPVNKNLVYEKALEKLLTSTKLNHLLRIDLEGCTNLTDAALSKLLDRLNVAQRLEHPERDNPQRLNIAVLNLKGCTQITEKAFDNTTSGELKNKLLESLNQVIIGETGIPANSVLRTLYPHVTFQEEYQPLTPALAIDKQLENCSRYLQLKNTPTLSPEDAAECASLAKTFLHDRTAVALFKDESLSPDMLHMVESSTFDPTDADFKDMNLSFQTTENAPWISFPIHKDTLYCQSKHYRNRLRVGNEEARASFIGYTNQNATDEAAQALVNLMCGQLIYDQLDWESAAQAAELVGDKNFKLEAIHYQKLIDRVLGQFDLENAFEIFTRADALENEALKKGCEANLKLLAEAAGFQRQSDVLTEIEGLALSCNFVDIQSQIVAIRTQWREEDERQINGRQNDPGEIWG